MTTPEYLLSQQ